MSKILYWHLFLTGPHSKFFKPTSTSETSTSETPTSETLLDVVQDIGKNNEENESSTESAETSSTIKELFINEKGPTTLSRDESVETTLTPESTDTPLTTSIEEESTPTSAPTSASIPTSGSSEPKAGTGDKGIEDADQEEATTMIGGEEEDVMTSKVDKDFQTKRHETRIKSGGAVVEYQVNERDLNQEKGCFTDTILTSSYHYTTADHSELSDENESDRGNEIVIEWGGNETEVI